MPELPEVEIIRRGILKSLPKDPVQKVTLFRKNLRFALPILELHQLKNKIILSIQRRGKFLIFKTDLFDLISHLGMTGHWRYEDNYKPIKHDHVLIQWNNLNLIYNDPRRFGYILKSNLDSFKNYGPDPLLDSIDPNFFLNKSKKSKTPIKTWLLNQNNILGVGNIYASEILFRSKIHPKKLACKLTTSNWQRVVEETKNTLLESIDRGGSSLRDYKNVDGEEGKMQNHWSVYNRNGLSCIICNAKIKKITQINRSTYFCSVCQKL